MRPRADGMVTALALGPKSSAAATSDAAAGSGHVGRPASLLSSLALSAAPSAAALAVAPLPLHPLAARPTSAQTAARIRGAGFLSTTFMRSRRLGAFGRC